MLVKTLAIVVSSISLAGMFFAKVAVGSADSGEIDVRDDIQEAYLVSQLDARAPDAHFRQVSADCMRHNSALITIDASLPALISRAKIRRGAKGGNIYYYQQQDHPSMNEAFKASRDAAVESLRATFMLRQDTKSRAMAYMRDNSLSSHQKQLLAITCTPSDEHSPYARTYESLVETDQKRHLNALGAFLFPE